MKLTSICVSGTSINRSFLAGPLEGNSKQGIFVQNVRGQMGAFERRTSLPSDLTAWEDSCNNMLIAQSSSSDEEHCTLGILQLEAELSWQIEKLTVGMTCVQDYG